MVDQESETNKQPLLDDPIGIDDRVERCSQVIGFPGSDLSRLRVALTHRSYSAEHEGTTNNERLEFLGDAVLDLVLTDILFRDNPMMPEGEMAKARSAVVNEDTLADIATELELGTYMYFGVGEERSGGATKRSIQADALEAVIAAFYLEHGYERAKQFIEKYWIQRAQISATNPGDNDYKTRFQEALIKYNSTKPKYVTVARGPEHSRTFEARVFSGDIEMGLGFGRSKKLAEQDAARDAINYISDSLEDV